jgi:hypothetical protein
LRLDTQEDGTRIMHGSNGSSASLLPSLLAMAINTGNSRTAASDPTAASEMLRKYEEN